MTTTWLLVPLPQSLKSGVEDPIPTELGSKTGKKLRSLKLFHQQPSKRVCLPYDMQPIFISSCVKTLCNLNVLGAVFQLVYRCDLDPSLKQIKVCVLVY